MIVDKKLRSYLESLGWDFIRGVSIVVPDTSYDLIPWGLTKGDFVTLMELPLEDIPRIIAWDGYWEEIPMGSVCSREKGFHKDVVCVLLGWRLEHG